MKVIRVINNNVIVSKNSRLEEVVLTGKGLGFNHKPGDLIDESLVEKTYVLTGECYENVDGLFNEIPIEYINATEVIVSNIKLRLGRKLSDNLIFSLSDHFHYAIKRYNDGQHLPHGLLHEYMRIYPDEYSSAVEAVKYINEKFSVNLPEDEYGFVTAHIINSSSNASFLDIKQTTIFVNEILNIITNNISDVDEQSINYYRFIIHLKFFAKRLLTNSGYIQNTNDDQLYASVKETYQQANQIVELISEFLETKHNYKIGSAEMLYLTIHINRLL